MHESKSADNHLSFEPRTFFHSRITEFFALKNHFCRLLFQTQSFQKQIRTKLFAENRTGMAGNRTATLESLSPISYRCDICKLAKKNKQKTKRLPTRSVAEVPMTTIFKYFFRRWSRRPHLPGQGQGLKKIPRPRPRTNFARTYALEAKNRNARSQGSRTQSSYLNCGSATFRQNLSARNRKFSGVLQNNKKSWPWPIFNESKNTVFFDRQNWSTT